jgi:hypothetical protein
MFLGGQCVSSNWDRRPREAETQTRRASTNGQRQGTKRGNRDQPTIGSTSHNATDRQLTGPTPGWRARSPFRRRDDAP